MNVVVLVDVYQRSIRPLHRLFIQIIIFLKQLHPMLYLMRSLCKRMQPFLIKRFDCLSRVISTFNH